MNQNSDAPRFYPVIDLEFAMVDNGVLIRERAFAIDSTKVTAFLNKDEFDTHLRNVFLKLREDLVYAAFDPEAQESRRLGRASTRRSQVP